MCTRYAGRTGSNLVAFAAAVLAACSGAGEGADSCRTIEHARCDRQAECEDWSESTRDECSRDRDARCKAGGTDAVRAMTGDEVERCAEAIGGAGCEALEAPESIDGCEGLTIGAPDGGERQTSDAGEDDQ
ncbi:MAG: hypothetical protein HYY06_06955 [Deltaproteobacteria bacterium]|nr:hypothetical protein [Deltaproteobacteria bacterium]